MSQTATATIGVPASATASGPLTVTLTSDNGSVVASTATSLPQGQNLKTVSLPILGLGNANVTASASGLASASMLVVGLDESGLVNQWAADDYVNNSTTWTDRIGNVVATATGVEVAEPGAFGPSHQGVARNSAGTTTGTSGFIIPAGTAPCNLSTYTIALAFKPTALGPSNANYSGSQVIMGFDIAGAGQKDFGISWGGGNPNPGRRIVAGIGRSAGDSGISGIPLAVNSTHAAALQVDAGAKTQTLFVDGILVGQNAGITMNTVNNQAIPLLNQSAANIASAFGGFLAEARIYNSASVNGAGLTAMLQNQYAGSADQGLELQIQRSGENVVLSWPHGQLLEAPSIGGPWTTNGAATSPYTVPATNSQAFYRVLVGP